MYQYLLILYSNLLVDIVLKATNKFRDKIVQLVKSNFLLLLITNKILRIINARKFNRAVYERLNMSIFSYQELSDDLPYYPANRLPDANFYGHIDALRLYSSSSTFNGSIEHGIYFGTYVPYSTFLKTTISIITMSQHRADMLRLAGFKGPIIVVGPYIHYASSLLDSRERMRIKKELGKTLLVFPVHSLADAHTDYDVKDFIAKIHHVGKEFESILVCLYYLDIRSNRMAEQYIGEGFKIVTAGHKYDPNFINRLKSIIELSDFTLSNRVGTHTGYCIHLNKPHFIYEQKVVMKNSASTHYRTEDELSDQAVEIAEIISCFNSMDGLIQHRQRKIVEKYWGTDKVKPVSDLRIIINNTTDEDYSHWNWIRRLGDRRLFGGRGHRGKLR